MKKNNPRAITFRITVYLLMFYLISFLVYFILFSKEPFHWVFLIISSIILSVVVALVIWQSVENLIYKKIRILYKTIHNLKSAKPKISRDSNWLENAEKEVVKWAEDQKNEMENLKEMETYRREFLGNVSHELKTPIFNIQGYVLTLLDGGLEDQSINREYLQRAEKSIDRMISIVSKLDVISKLESDANTLYYEKFDMHELCSDLISVFEVSTAKKYNNILINPNTQGSFYVFADKELIKQVVSNLMENAIKYGRENGRTKISFYDMDEQILTEVSDDGIGISQQDIPRIFERFYRAAQGRNVNKSGSGLGLSIVKHIIEAHNQTINVRSTLGVGTTFGFTLKKA